MSTLSIYEAADWGAKVAGAASARRDPQGALFIDEVPVETIQVSGMFSVLGCADGKNRVVLSSFLRLVRAPSGV
ncbi:hypothetical protein K2Z83_13045 [Oscillochloris sp. ZM17-4]|uniref:hypothetical protein n=1 Tax=Oscillochloris sp. ZM17-4 TaxID=2866714 RepID=UPI001C72C61D|nr:hypothetical protein [Oscillochloris sp. ZM17-4]MBX0328605.1 hypothetical protein [Oscillochloris sp. ZM17-4]